MNSLKGTCPISPFSVSPRPVHRLKLNTLLRLTFILLLGGAGLTVCANIQQAQAADKQENDETVSYIEYLKTEAEQGYVEGWVDLSQMYEEGRGIMPQALVEQSRKAAEQGDFTAQAFLGSSYAEGMGVPKNYVYAYMWMDIARMNFASDNVEGEMEIQEVMAFFEKQMTLVEEKMTSSQVKKAKELARACERKQYKDCEV